MQKTQVKYLEKMIKITLKINKKIFNKKFKKMKFFQYNIKKDNIN